MSKDHQNSTFKELLDKLQQESWQLELLISGFAIFGLFTASETIGTKLDIAQYDKRIVDTLLWMAALISCWILVANLLIHVVLRGLWIGALGLRYVSGDIDYEELKYSERFTKYLKKRIGSFDKYIATLENYCSVVFAVSFIFIFYFLASFAFILFLLVIVFIFLEPDYEGVWHNITQITGIGLILFTLLGMLLTFIDFITQGFLKRKKWTSFLYLPLYRIYSKITFSFLYRPLVYNLLDNRFGRRLSWVLVPVYIGILYLSTYYYNDSNYIKADQRSSENFANYGNYEDLMSKENDFINFASIPSKVITDPYLKVFMIFDDNMETRLLNFNPGLKPLEDERGYTSGIEFNNGSSNKKDRIKKDSLRKEFFKTFNYTYDLYIDNSKFDTEFIATTNVYKKLGFETYINIDSLKEGKHILKIQRKYINRETNDTLNRRMATIPFWTFKSKQR